jgi:hypothetical protein
MARALSVSILAIAAAPDGALAASLCMDVHGQQAVQVVDCLNRANEEWSVQRWAVQDVIVVNFTTEKSPLLCLDLWSGDTTNGNAVAAWDCSGNVNQQWVFGDDNHIRYHADRSKCVDAGDMQDGTQLQIWDCNGLSQQNWGHDDHRKTIYLSDSRRLQAPALGRLRGARNASAAASNLAAAAALTTGGQLPAEKHAIMTASAKAFPVLPSPATFRGTFEAPAKGVKANLTWFYDAGQSMWMQILQGPGVYSQFFVKGTTLYSIQQNGECSVRDSGALFGVGSSQFANFTKMEEPVVDGSPLQTWVGTFQGYVGTRSWSQVIQCKGEKSDPCDLKQLISIDMPGWTSELKVFDTISPEVPADAFQTSCE